MSDVVLISGSPSEHSGSAKILDYIGIQLTNKEYTIATISVIDIPLADLFYGRYNSPAIANIMKELREAKGVVIASPVYKASYTGVLKMFLDILPKDAFRQKVVLPLMTGGSSAHLLALEYTLKPIISVLKGNSLSGVYVTNSQIDKTKSEPVTDPQLQERIVKQLAFLDESIRHNRIDMK